MSTTDTEAIRALIENENDLRDQTLRWLFTLNGFLFATLGFAWKDAGSLVYVLAALGVAMAVTTVAGLTAIQMAIRRLRDKASVPTDGPGVVGLTSDDLKEMGGVYRLIPYLYPWKVVPALLGLAWVAVILVRWL